MRKLIFMLALIVLLLQILNANATTVIDANTDQSLPPSVGASAPAAIANNNNGKGESLSYGTNNLNVVKPNAIPNTLYGGKSHPPHYKFTASPAIMQPSTSPTFQTNFQPLQIQGPTPVIMQYLPQNQYSNNGVQYLQLIPTRPLIVPIMAQSAQQYSGNQNNMHKIVPNHQMNFARSINNNPMAQQVREQNQIVAAQTAAHPLYAQGSLIGGYTTNIPNFRLFRVNKGMEIIDGPQNLNLNTNEYIPSPNDPPAPRVARGRP